MTFRFNYTQFTANDAGRKLVCVRTTSDYFTVGKTYIIKMDGNSPCLITDDGQHLHATGSEFEFYNKQDLTPKQPKVGEVWAFKPDKWHYREYTLYFITKIDAEGIVHHKGVDGAMPEAKEGTARFLARHTFVF